ncbi:hypothetical protein AZE42_07864, partial [Rhizopogon vesiculosus]
MPTAADSGLVRIDTSTCGIWGFSPGLLVNVLLRSEKFPIGSHSDEESASPRQGFRLQISSDLRQFARSFFVGGFGNHIWTNTGAMAIPYTTESILRDVTPLQDKPLWPLSSYGAAKYEPIVIGGLDESPEELRVKAVTALKAGIITEYMKYESDKLTASDQAYSNAGSNAQQLYDAAFKLSKEAALSGSNVLGPMSAFGGKSAFGSGAGAGSAFGSGSTFGAGATPS